MAESNVQWLLEWPHEYNEGIVEYLYQLGIGNENFRVGMHDTRGQPHNVCIIPKEHLREFVRLRNTSKPELRIWHRRLPNPHISPADFLDKRYTQVISEEAKLKSVNKLKVMRED